MRRAQLAEFVAKKRGQGGREGLNNEGSSSSDRGVQEEVRDAYSRGLREDVNDVYSDPLYRVGDLVVILKDTRPGVSYKDSYDTEGKVIVRAELQLLFVIVFFIKRFPTK